MNISGHEQNGLCYSESGSTSNGHHIAGHLGNGHLKNGSSESLEHVISQGTETVRALTEALKRDEQRFSLPRDDKRSSLADKPAPQLENNIAGSYFKTKYGGVLTGDQNGKSEVKNRAVNHLKASFLGLFRT